jgi:hypothetical protein
VITVWKWAREIWQDIYGTYPRIASHPGGISGIQEEEAIRLHHGSPTTPPFYKVLKIVAKFMSTKSWSKQCREHDVWTLVAGFQYWATMRRQKLCQGQTGVDHVSLTSPAQKSWAFSPSWDTMVLALLLVVLRERVLSSQSWPSFEGWSWWCGICCLHLKYFIYLCWPRTWSQNPRSSSCTSET